MKKIILIASLLMAGGLWAEQKLCKVNSDTYGTVGKSVKVCEAGDILSWSGKGDGIGIGAFIVANYCDQEKEITYGGKRMNYGVCTYTGKKLKTRY